jgi:YegS/Rv2252/BmrU family lipid kinase
MIDQSYIFIINPKAGLGRNHLIEDMIRTAARNYQIDIEIHYTEAPGDAAEIAYRAVQENRAVVVAVGGDGTINEIACQTMQSATALGIIAGGSGNGLARHYGVPKNSFAALRAVFVRKTTIQDSVSVNGMMSFNISGVGLDAHIAHHFGGNGKRGMASYMKLVLKELPFYKSHALQIHSAENEISGNFQMACICTGTQFGNNAKINPQGNTLDGKTELVCVKDIPFYAVAPVVYKTFYSDVSKSKYIDTYRQNDFVITSPVAVPLHVDGEPRGHHTEIKVKTIPRSLYLIVP